VTRLSGEAELAAALPDARHGLAQLLVRDVEVSLRLLDVGVTEHQLDRSDVDAVGQQPAGTRMRQRVPRHITSNHQGWSQRGLPRQPFGL
jgi:hypothetical protein